LGALGSRTGIPGLNRVAKRNEQATNKLESSKSMILQHPPTVTDL